MSLKAAQWGEATSFLWVGYLPGIEEVYVRRRRRRRGGVNSSAYSWFISLSILIGTVKLSGWLQV